MHVLGGQGPSKRLVIAADSSLIIEAIAIGIRESGAFEFLGHVPPRTTSISAIARAEPDVVLLDDCSGSPEAVELVARIKAEDDCLPVLVLSSSMDPNWLDALFAVGATGAISKATHPAALATLVRETIDGHVVHLYETSRLPKRGRLGAAPGEQGSLTSRELEILQLVAGGATNDEIAHKLWVTTQTVKFHLSNVYRKLDVGNRTEASHYAHLNGLVGPAEANGTR